MKTFGIIYFLLFTFILLEYLLFYTAWLKPKPEGCVIHSFRHSMRDRLREVQCPADMIDQIGGWSTAGIGQAYGEGYNLKALFYNMKDI